MQCNVFDVFQNYFTAYEIDPIMWPYHCNVFTVIQYQKAIGQTCCNVIEIYILVTKKSLRSQFRSITKFVSTLTTLSVSVLKLLM